MRHKGGIEKRIVGDGEKRRATHLANVQAQHITDKRHNRRRPGGGLGSRHNTTVLLSCCRPDFETRRRSKWHFEVNDEVLFTTVNSYFGLVQNERNQCQLAFSKRLERANALIKEFR